MAFLELNGWDTGIRFSASHFIPGHPKCGRLHGHVYGVRVRIHGEIGENHMVMDFIDLKRWLRNIVEGLDHHVLIPASNPGIEIAEGEEITVRAAGKRYVFPKEDVVLLPVPMCSAEELARHLLNRCVKEIPFPSNVTRVELGVDEGRGQGGWASRDMG